MRGPEADLALDAAALLIAAHARPALDVEAERQRLDELAAACPDATFEAWHRHLFVDLGFTGNAADYHDPDNSFLDQVLRRHVGIPISLSVLGLEVGRRLGLTLAGVGLPGHFLLRRLDSDGPGLFVDAFDDGRVLDEEACIRRFHALHGDRTPFRPDYLAPVGPRAILARMLANLKRVYEARDDLESLRWVLELRLAIPGVPESERADLAEALVRRGGFVDAARELEALADVAADGEDRDDLLARAQGLRARLN